MSEAKLERLPIAPLLKTREWWGTYIWRLSLAGHFDPPSLLISHLRDILQLIEQHDSLDAPTNAHTYRALSKLINQDMETIYKSTIHSMGTVLPVANDMLGFLELGECKFSFLKGGFADFLWPIRGLQYCPICLKELGYVPLEWLFKLHPVCTQHQCLLKQNCPHCNGRLNAYAVQAQTCKHCEGNLTETNSIPVQKTDRAFLASHTIINIISTQKLSVVLENTLPNDFTVQVALTLMALVFNWLSSNIVPKEWFAKSGIFDSISQIDSDDVGSAYFLASIAYRILENWPCHFYEFIDVLRLQNLGTRRLSYAGIDRLFLKWFLLHWNSPEYAAIHRAFAPYFYKELNKNSHQEISQYDRFLREKGYLDSYFEDKYAEWRTNHCMTKAELSSFLVLPESMLNDITASRLIEKRFGSSESDTKLYSTFSAQSLLQRVRASINPINEATNELISFETAILEGLKPSRLIKLVLLSELTAYTSAKSSQSYIHNLYFKSKDLNRLRNE